MTGRAHPEQIVLHFETADDRRPSSRIAAQALLDWVTLVETVANEIAPNSKLSVEIVGGAVPGSTRFPQILRWTDERIGDMKLAWDEYPHLKSMIVGASHTFWTAGVAAGVSLAIAPQVQAVKLSDDDRALLTAMQEQVWRSRPAKEASKRFYRTLEQEPAIAGIGVADSWAERPSVIIPRSQFPERGGMWEPQDEIRTERIVRNDWQVVLLRPVLQATPHAWRFSRDGLAFSAMMHDAQFLAALRDGRIPLNLQEGVMMRVEVEHVERLHNQIWEPVPRSWRVVRVLSPAPRSSP